MTPIQVHVTGDNTTLITALVGGGAGIVGVIAGSALSSLRELLTRRYTSRARRRHATRVLVNELSWVMAGAEGLAETGDPSEWDSDSDELASLWRTHRDALADIPLDDWFVVEAAVRDVTSLDFTETDDVPLNEQRRDAIRLRAAKRVERVKKARSAIMRYL
jgi:hypothetical protein